MQSEETMWLLFHIFYTGLMQSEETMWLLFHIFYTGLMQSEDNNVVAFPHLLYWSHAE